MSINPVVSSISIYPVKSLDGLALKKALVADGGCFLHDREYVITNEQGNFITGKKNPAVYTLRSAVDVEKETISFRQQHELIWNHFHLLTDRSGIESYLGNYFGSQVKLHQNKTGRFLDIPDLSGITLVSTSTLLTVAGWYNLDLAEIRKRFRATVEIDGVPAFWEDHLFSQEGRGVEFKIGEVTLVGTGPRARCTVPPRNPETGEVIHAFPKTFSKHRAETVPAWSTLPEYGHYYFLAVDCHIPATETGKWIKEGDAIEIIGEKVFS